MTLDELDELAELLELEAAEELDSLKLLEVPGVQLASMPIVANKTSRLFFIFLPPIIKRNMNL